MAVDLAALRADGAGDRRTIRGNAERIVAQFRGVYPRPGRGWWPGVATRLSPLTFLAPDIIATVLDGRHPPGLILRKLLDDTRLPLDWSARGVTQ